MWDEGASFASLLGSGRGQPGLQREAAPCPLRREVAFELCLKAQPFLTQLAGLFSSRKAEQVLQHDKLYYLLGAKNTA